MGFKECWKTKAEARSQSVSQLDKMNESVRLQAEASLNAHLSVFLLKYQGPWGGYQALRSEVSPSQAIHQSHHLKWAYPRMEGNKLEFYLEPQQWSQGPFGVREPTEDFERRIGVDQLEGCLIPGLGFDRQGTRLGRGKGFYDRALSDFRGLKVGVCFQNQFFDERLPREVFDVPMDFVLTECGVVFSHCEGDR